MSPFNRYRTMIIVPLIAIVGLLVIAASRGELAEMIGTMSFWGGCGCLTALAIPIFFIVSMVFALILAGVLNCIAGNC